MPRDCVQCSAHFEVTENDQAFYRKMDVPPPTLCPPCRMQRRLSYRNDRTLYRSASSFSGKQMLSMYDPAHNYVVYDQDEWWSDAWNPLLYGRPFDFSQSFFEQFSELKKAVPRFALFNKGSENSDYVNYAPHCKNCYLLFGSWFNEDCYYGQTLNECKNCTDNLFIDRSELCYENIDCDGNFASAFCQNCSGTADSFFCFDCRNVANSIACWNLRAKKYWIWNQQSSKEDYDVLKRKLASLQFLADFRKQFDAAVASRAIHRAFVGHGNDTVSGNYVFNSKHASFCFSVYRSEDVSYSARMIEQNNTYDFEGGGKGELVYEGMSNDFSHNSIGCTTCEHMTDTHYCDLCFSCKDCFGCVGLRHAQYCILNRQYSETEYESLLPKIIQRMRDNKEWGEFPPTPLSPFGYDETLAQEYYHLTKEEALARGYRWNNASKTPAPTHAPSIPDSITDIPDTIIDETLACASCGGGHKIISQELAFLRRIGLPVPRTCHTCRHRARFGRRTPRRLWERTCSKCGTAIQTTYSPERPEQVHCEQCYLQEVY